MKNLQRVKNISVFIAEKQIEGGVSTECIAVYCTHVIPAKLHWIQGWRRVADQLFGMNKGTGPPRQI